MDTPVQDIIVDNIPGARGPDTDIKPRDVKYTSLLRDLHWLWVPERLEFKLSVLVFRLVTARSSSLRRVPGTLCHPASLRLRHSAPSSVV